LARVGVRRPVIVPIADGVAVTGVTVSLARGAAIGGRLLDDLGEPIANGNIFVERLVEVGGVRSTRERRTPHKRRRRISPTVCRRAITF
jgi:hypothetical protein